MATMIVRWVSGVLAALAPGSRRSGKPAVGDIAAELPGDMDAFKSVIGDLAREGTVVRNLPPATLERLIRERVSRLWGNADEIDAVTDSENRAARPRPPSASRQFPPDEWEWFGSAAHFCCGQWCRFHLATKVGPFIVSTVGEYVHPLHSGGSERTESEWLASHWPGDDVGLDRKYETMVFRAPAASSCLCGCRGLVHQYINLACPSTTGTNSTPRAT